MISHLEALSRNLPYMNIYPIFLKILVGVHKLSPKFVNSNRQLSDAVLKHDRDADRNIERGGAFGLRARRKV